MRRGIRYLWFDQQFDMMKNPCLYFLTFYFCLISLLFLVSCEQGKNAVRENQSEDAFYRGADLSYVNEMDDCGGVFRKDGKKTDPYQLFAEEGCGLVRLRLWHSPAWTDYSNFKDVKRSIRRAKENNMPVLLDFHYSDTWADPQKQIIPEAWKMIDKLEVLGDSLYNYTFNTLAELNDEGLYPEMVQVGNEINIEILQQEDEMNLDSIDWPRNVYLLNKGIEAVKKANELSGNESEIMLHIAQPENAMPWFKKAFQYGIAGFDWIGLSYYPKWSSFDLVIIPTAIKDLKDEFGKGVMIVETAYPYSFISTDEAHNILGEDALHTGYPATPQGQLDFLLELTQLCREGGGEGVIYWEPAWISTDCSTPWGQGSHWENATFFDAANGNETLPAFKFFHE